jgi:hypothetical protein
LIYCYETEDGDVVEQHYPVGQAPRSIEVAGKRAFRCFSAERKSVPPTKGWPIVCFASGVNAEQAPELRRHFERHGVNVKVTNDGDPVYENATQRKKALKCRGMLDKSSYI